ncbi:MAG: hypothetical protein JW995_14420 [Melioribacteraceae bacterium]|nr:hypothetical protein [Melioribacteraceae bacterium]
MNTPSPKRRILVIGSTVIDNFSTGGSVITKPGGIYYTCTGLVNIIGNDDAIDLLTNYDRRSYILFKDVYDRINLKHSRIIDKINTVTLIEHAAQERMEVYSDHSIKLKIDDDISFNDYNGVLINMISGIDIDLNDLHAVRKKYKGMIYLDIHTLSRGIGKELHRHFRVIPDAAEWIRNVDIIQVNKSELYSLSIISDREKLTEWIFSLGVKILIVTLGSEGVIMHYRKDNEICTKALPATEVKAVNLIGCGDIFGAVFFYSYIKSGDPESALIKANKCAGFATTFLNFKEYKKLREIFNSGYD